MDSGRHCNSSNKSEWRKMITSMKVKHLNVFGQILSWERYVTTSRQKNGSFSRLKDEIGPGVRSKRNYIYIIILGDHGQTLLV